MGQDWKRGWLEGGGLKKREMSLMNRMRKREKNQKGNLLLFPQKKNSLLEWRSRKKRLKKNPKRRRKKNKRNKVKNMNLGLLRMLLGENKRDTLKRRVRGKEKEIERIEMKGKKKKQKRLGGERLKKREKKEQS